MRMFQIWIFFAAMTGLLWSQPQQISSNGMYWPTGSSSRTSQIYSQTPGLGGTWLAPGPMIDSVTGIQTPRYTQDQTGSVRIGSYFTNEFHLGFDILNDTSEEHHPIYALADGQIMHLSYGQPGASQDTFGNGGWGNTDCAEIGLLNSSLVLPSVCNDNQRAGNVALVVKYKLADGRTFYAVYGHLIDTNETPRSMPGATLLEGDVKQDCTKELDSDITGIASAEQVQSAPKRPFHPCDIFTAGELIGYTGDWPHTRHLHFGIAPYKMVVTNLGLSAYDSSTWPDDGSVVNCYDSDGVSHNCLSTGFLQADGTYLDQVNPISFITDPNNVPSNWMQTMGIETTVGAPPIFADFFASAVEYNWSYTSEGDQGPTLTYVPGKVTIQVPVLSSGSSSGTLVSNQHFSGNIDVTFNVNLTGKGESIVGLYSETSGWLTFADLHATATPELLFYSPWVQTLLLTRVHLALVEVSAYV